MIKEIEKEFDIRVERVANSNLAKIDFDNIPFGRVFADHMFVVDFDGTEWVDARIVPYENLQLSPAISALHYGQSIFEGMKAYRDQDGKPQLFRPRDNHKRLNTSAERMCMPTMKEELFINGLQRLLEIDQEWIPRNPSDTLYVRPFMFATDEFLGVKESKTYRFMIFSSPVGPYYNKPLKVKVSTDYVRAFPGGVGYAKAAGNYAASLYPARLAMKEGFDQLIWLDGIEKKYIEESGTMNLFFVIDGTLVTPETSAGTILNGITRDSTIRLARDNGIPVRVSNISIDELVEAYDAGVLEEAFGAGTAATLAYISEINYKGKKMTLKDDDSDSLRNRLRNLLEDIKVSKAPDPYGWVYKI